MPSDHSKRPPTGLRPAGALVAKVMAPIAAKRGFAGADILAAWPEIAGDRYRDCTRPESISFPRDRKSEGKGVLTLRVEGGKAIYLQHELGVMIERINAFVGFAAIGAIRLVQMPLPPPPAPRQGARQRPLTAADRDGLRRGLAGIEDDGLREALARLGEGVLSEKSPKSEI
jgi:hypothetical protein